MANGGINLEQKPNVGEATKILIDKRLKNSLYTSFIAKVLKYDSERNTCEVEAVVKSLNAEGDQDKQIVLTDVPFARTETGNTLIFADMTDANVTVFIAKEDFSGWYFAQQPDLVDETPFSLSGAFCMLGISNKNTWVQPAGTSGIMVDNIPLWLGDKNNEIVGLMVEMIDLLSGTVSGAGLSYNGQLTLIQPDLAAMKAKLEAFKP